MRRTWNVPGLETRCWDVLVFFPSKKNTCFSTSRICTTLHPLIIVPLSTCLTARGLNRGLAGNYSTPPHPPACGVSTIILLLQSRLEPMGNQSVNIKHWMLDGQSRFISFFLLQLMSEQLMKNSDNCCKKKLGTDYPKRSYLYSCLLSQMCLRSCVYSNNSVSAISQLCLDDKTNWLRTFHLRAERNKSRTHLELGSTWSGVILTNVFFHFATSIHLSFAKDGEAPSAPHWPAASVPEPSCQCSNKTKLWRDKKWCQLISVGKVRNPFLNLSPARFSWSRPSWSSARLIAGNWLTALPPLLTLPPTSNFFSLPFFCLLIKTPLTAPLAVTVQRRLCRNENEGLSAALQRRGWSGGVREWWGRGEGGSGGGGGG